MKPFDLQEALNGAPVKLRSGQKAYVIGISKIATENDNSYIIGEYAGDLCNWSKNGKYGLFPESKFDIIGMWEEPELTSEQVLEKAFNEGLFVAQSANCQIKLKVIAKAKDEGFILEAANGFMSKSVDGEYVLYKDLAPKSDTITVTLPKPFKPKEGEVYYSIGGYHNGSVVKMRANCMTDISILSGNCFRTESDAKAWLDAMENALDD